MYADMLEGSYNGESFIAYMEQLLERMNPWPLPQSVLVMDNCSIHHVEDVAIMCANK